jgi:hypothetical protein
LRLESGLSHHQLAAQTLLDKKLILDHVVRGKKPQPKTLKLYAETFSTLLHRKITVVDLLAN